MVSTAVRNGFTLYLDKTGMLTASATNKSSEIKLPEKLLGFRHIGNALSRIYMLIYNEYPQKLKLVTIDSTTEDYDGTDPIVITTESAHTYLKAICKQNRYC